MQSRLSRLSQCYTTTQAFQVMFSCTTLAKQFILDTRHWIDGSNMNPNAMFEYFGLFSNDTSKQVHKAMIKYLRLNKKKGWEDCAILKNDWIALALQGKDAKTWSVDMKKINTPGDEITLYTLCKMYHHHCVVYTKMKSWCTIDQDSRISEENFVDNCDIIVLFIEAGVYGELKTRPFALPPNHAILQDATADLPKICTSADSTENGTTCALDLHADEHKSDVEPPANEQKTDAITEVTDNVDTSKNSMLQCVVRLTKLTDRELQNVTVPDQNTSKNIGGYALRSHPAVQPRLDRLAKYNVNYGISTDSSSDDTDGKQRPKKRPIAALSGPMPESLAAHACHQKEKITADALLELSQNPSDGETNQDVAGQDTSQPVSPKSADKDNSEQAPVPTDNATNLESTAGNMNSAAKVSSPEIDDDMPLSQIQERLREEPGSSNTTPGNMTGKATFQSVFHGLKHKHQHNHNFQCSSCDDICKSQGELNKHYLSNHGNLKCI